MTKPEGYPDTPNLDIQEKHRTEAQSISNFIDFLFDEQGYFLGEVRERGTDFLGDKIETYERARWGDLQRREMIERFFGMDPEAASQEREAVYQWLVAQNPKEAAHG